MLKCSRSSLFLECYGAPVLDYFVPKFARVKFIFRTKFCPGLRFVFLFLRGEKWTVQPRSFPGLGPGASSPSLLYRVRPALFRILIILYLDIPYTFEKQIIFSELVLNCYAMKFSWQLAWQRWKQESVAICRRHVVLCNLGSIQRRKLLVRKAVLYNILC